jgi:parvulin-like peptidyl-prolyl isomerase
MLKILRDKKNAKKIWITLCAVIIVPFIFWGAGSSVRNRGETTDASAGTIFGRKVPVEDYTQAVQAVQIQALMQYGDKLEEVRDYLNLEGQAWDRLILLREAKRRRIRISDKEVVATIQRYPFFKKDGVFSEETYQHILRYGFRMQPRAFEELTRQTLMILEVYKQETGGVTLDDTETIEEYAKAHEKIGISYLAALPEDFEKTLSPTDDELKAYYEANTVIFKKPAAVNAEYLESESEVTIRQVASSLAKQKDMAKAAKEFNLPVRETGFFDEMTPPGNLDWSPMVVRIIAQMKEKEVSPPFKAKDRYYVIIVKQRTEAHIPAFEEVKDKVLRRFLLVESANKAQSAANAAQEHLVSAVKDGTVNLEAVAKEHGLRVQSLEPFSFGAELDELGASGPFWLAAKPLQEGAFSPVISTHKGYYIVQAKERIPVDEEKFKEEKSDFGEKLLERKRQEQFERFLWSLRRQATG